MSLATKLAELNDAMAAFATALKAKVLNHVPVAQKADNAIKFADKTYGEIIAENEADLQAHIDDPNAHQVSAESFGTYEKSEIITRYGQKLKSGIVPVSKVTINQACTLDFNNATNKWELTTSQLFVAMCGMYWSFTNTVTFVIYDKDPTTVFDFDNLGLDTEIYCYFELFEGQLYVTWSLTPKPETLTCMYVTTILSDDIINPFSGDIVNGSTITTQYTTNTPILRIDTARISPVSRGNAIPVSGETSSLLWT